MPTYEYECPSCGHRAEAMQRMSDPPALTCARCGGEMRRRLGAGAGFIMKGKDPRRAGGRAEGGCALRSTGRTCCGRDERCDEPPCGGGR
ncbi:MAG: zinc ribbon domain-containing protein [Planctomycetes bacterium]|nr:zinc ribbon domain-containing protein [Planctomycetota bacterium]